MSARSMHDELRTIDPRQPGGYPRRRGGHRRRSGLTLMARDSRGPHPGRARRGSTRQTCGEGPSGAAGAPAFACRPPRSLVAGCSSSRTLMATGGSIWSSTRRRSRATSSAHAEGGWAPFMALPNLPHIDWNDPNLRFIDLDGDGFPDVLITEDRRLRLVPIARPRTASSRRGDRARSAKDELKGPAVVFADGSRDDPARRHERRWPGRYRASAQRRGLLLAESRSRPVRAQGHARV